MRNRSSHVRAATLGLLLVLVLGLGPGGGWARSSAAQEDPAPAPDPSADEGGDSLPEIAGADANWWATVQEEIRRSEYFVTWQEETYLDDLPAAYQAPNRAHNLRTYFAEGGPVVIPRVWPEGAGAPPWRWQGQLVGWGRQGDLAAVSPAALVAVENWIEYQRGAVLEWYRNDEEGLAQGFSLPAPPQGGQDGTFLQLDLALGGDLTPEIALEGAEIDFLTPDGSDGLRYGGLQAVDARGEPLPAWLAVEGATLSLLVDDGQAIYPIDIQMTLTGLPTEASWSLPFGQLGARFGISVATAGDVDGDGYSDLIVGAPYYDGGLADEGAVFVYSGARDGELFSDWFEEIDQAGAHFGRSVATAGDVNGDGYADVIIGAPDYSHGETHEGGTWVYHGSDRGLSHEAATHDEGNQANAAFGQSVATAGDVNGDGYSDVIVGAPLYNNGESEEGMAWVWHGSENGLSDVHNWHAEGDLPDGSFGQSVATAGDVNGDGFADIIVGSTRYTSGGQTWEGAAFVWLGSLDGLNGGDDGNPTNEHRHLQIDQDYARFGWSVSTAGDVNGDGFSDVLVGAPYYTNGEASEGGAWLYLGSGSGLSASPANQDEGNQAQAHFGWSVGTAGDVNGDGRADVLVGAPDYGTNDEGRAWLWYGQATTTGISTSNNWTVAGEEPNGFFGTSVFTAGDVNGDGYSDVVVGAPSTADPAGEGVIYAYYGSPDGPQVTATWTKPSNQANALFGFSVGTAGDVNGDGYADVIAGAPRWDGGEVMEGGIWVYQGSAGGLVSKPLFDKFSDQAYAEFGTSVGTAGDVNGDGYDDIIVGAPSWESNQDGEGGAWIYKGSASGPVAAPLWHKEGDQVGAAFGTSVGTAGDVNGDGYADVIIGAPAYNHGSTDEGMAWIYHGTATVPHRAPDWDGESNQADAAYGQAVGTAGDVNGDGYSDVIVGAPMWNGGNPSEGRAYVYLGSPSGVNEAHAWRVNGSKFNAQYGYAVGTAGDVNGDGLADFLVGAPYWYDDLNGEGRVWLYEGSRGVLETTSAWHAEGGQLHAHYGSAVGTAGDVNGDGYADVIIGAPGWNGDQTDEGGASLYYGSVIGLGTDPAWHGESNQTGSFYGAAVGTAGDVNGDGYAEIVVGAHKYHRTSELQDEGQIFLHYGNGGPGVSLNPRQARTGSSVPIAHLGWSDSMDGLRIYTKLQTPFGRGRLQQQAEIKPFGVRFDGAGTVWWGGYDDHEPGDDWYMTIGNLPAGTLYHWRVRLRYDPATTPWMPASRWLTMPWNGWNEADFRTAGWRVTLPVILTNYD